ncbi:MAG TPA: zinc-ribbon domain-containing protein [Myxococcota bacterium]|nr:zinc-ribbon domain-containing protein [Myxococcota bacterium]
MIVTCERCSTQFQLDDARVPQRGVRVRCSRCKHAFRVVPPPATAREDSRDETTQDLDDSRGARRSERSAAASRAEHEPEAEAAAGGPDAEESDWKFNEDVSEESGSSARPSRQESKPDPPAARRGREADDWFSGGSDAPLELDDRPWDAGKPDDDTPVAEEPAAPQAAAAFEAPTPARDTPAADSEPEPPEQFDAVAELARQQHEEEAPAFAPADEKPAEAQADASPSDELSGEGWDELFGDSDEAVDDETAKEPEKSKRRSWKPPRIALPSLGGALQRVGRAVGMGAQALGWAVTLGLFGVGLYAGFATRAPAAPVAERVAGFEVVELEGRFVENAVSGRLYVVSGRLRNPGPEVRDLSDLSVELLDAAGVPLSERAALHAPIAKEGLRETAASRLLEGPPLVAAAAPGDVLTFDAVFASLPDAAAAFRLTDAGARNRGGPLPEVQLPR